MLGLKEGENGAAPIGDGDTTQIRTAYSHPEIKQVVYYDLPGFGTPSFERTDEYLREIEVESYDFSLIFYHGTISEGDIWLINKLLAMRKMFALVRTRADEMTRRQFPLQKCIQDAKDRCERNLQGFGIMAKVSVFVISNIDVNIGEMDGLFRFIRENLPEMKRRAITVHVQAKTKEIIAQKEKQFLEEMWRAAYFMGLSTGIPIPGIEVPINYKILVAKIKSYLLSFGLSAEMFEKLPEDIKKRMKITSDIHKSGLKRYVLSNISLVPVIIQPFLVFQAFSVLLPVAGSIVSGTNAFVSYLNFLKHVITKMAEDARTLQEYHVTSVD
ncbi:hypothetical protein FSP39_002827 [Pinctada imbricata]|uniref:IRG-type G domain-containing protein n=1 Tax=Pinctada imbricata TaxID=66713 RepID=A0AA88YUL4_PINIB|nr:hypothetical protein FSP39_002827 [Pinctada imbricata]